MHTFQLTLAHTAVALVIIVRHHCLAVMSPTNNMKQVASPCGETVLPLCKNDMGYLLPRDMIVL